MCGTMIDFPQLVSAAIALALVVLVLLVVVRGIRLLITAPSHRARELELLKRLAEAERQDRYGSAAGRE
jgi:uncharacterized membrane-anchored protein